MSHISRIAFCGLRRLNKFELHDPEDLFDLWMANPDWLDFGKINVFIGANGGGKSTILELIDSLRNPHRLVNLPRENNKATMLSAFHIEFEGNKRLIARAIPNKVPSAPYASNLHPQEDKLSDIQYLDMIGLIHGKQIFRFKKNISKSELDIQSENELKNGFDKYGCSVSYWEKFQEQDGKKLARMLNEASKYLHGVLSPNFVPVSEYDKKFSGALSYKKENPFHWNDANNKIGIFLSDDTGQSNYVHSSALPTGWLQLCSILAWLQQCPKGSICLIEEPETHLHPQLQRYLAQKIGEIVSENALQIFLPTHSTVFQQANVWRQSANVFEASSDRITTLNSAWKVLDALGIKSSDISQSNGIVWVEGPSDRKYIKHWLKIFCEANGENEPLENVDYSFAFYGGSLLSHFSIADSESFIDMLRINRNLIIVMDRDKDFEDGNLICKNKKSAKARVLEDLKKLDPETYYAWVTDKYTIESYLPEVFREKYFDDDHGQLRLKTGTKMEIALRYSANFNSMKSCSDIQDKLFAHVDKLHRTITRWQMHK